MAVNQQSNEVCLSGFRKVPRTGVIYVTTEASRCGYRAGDLSWSNLGQGAPEHGELEDAPARITSIDIDARDNEYAPVDGLPELKDAIADLYNQRYRRNKRSKYTRENVSISAGGRLALARVVFTLGRTHLGHFLPDYTAYEELLGAFGNFVPIPIPLDPAAQYEFSASDLEAEILGKGFSAVLLSNPCNPTGKVILGDELDSWIRVSRRLDCCMIFDEFYSHYVYGNDGPMSAAEYIEDVNRDPVVILDGLTKNWRYPGWRVSWTLAPKSIIEKIASAASFLDGGCSRPMQRATLNLVGVDQADAEAKAIKKVFLRKRGLLQEGLESVGIKVISKPQGGFYCWGDLSKLPEHINTGMSFFEAALKEKVIVVPGQFFDINPGHRRHDRPSRFQHYARFSFGPSEAEVVRGIEGLGRAIKRIV